MSKKRISKELRSLAANAEAVLQHQTASAAAEANEMPKAAVSKEFPWNSVETLELKLSSIFEASKSLRPARWRDGAL